MSTARKCLIWDLDNTLWEGVCLEGAVRLRPEAALAIKELDGRGILHSIASRGDADLAMGILRKFGLDSYFLAPQVNWLPKSQNIRKISQELRLPLDSMAFLDDDRFEREQVAYMLPGVLILDSAKLGTLPNLPAFAAAEVTPEARARRALYQAELERARQGTRFPSREEFLKFCRMRLTVRPMTWAEIPRVLELMTRTHRLNTTGLGMNRMTLENACRSAGGTKRVVVAELHDRFGSYGIIATAVMEVVPPTWRLTHLAISCRVMGRGIERALIASLADTAQQQGCLNAEALYRSTGRNRMMRALYQIMGFRAGGEKEPGPKLKIFSARTEAIAGIPSWVEVV
jgi:FkbH-like protein